MKIKELRESAQKKVKEISELLNISVQAYYNYENEQTIPNINTLCKLADYYNVSLDYLVGRKFGNDFGFLTKEQISSIKLYLTLNDFNQARVSGYIANLIENQS